MVLNTRRMAEHSQLKAEAMHQMVVGQLINRSLPYRPDAPRYLRPIASSLGTLQAIHSNPVTVPRPAM